MKLTAEIENEKHALDIRREGGRVKAMVDGRSYELEVREPEAGVYLLIADAAVYECRTERDRQQRHLLHVDTGNHAYAIALTDPKRLRAGGQSPSAQGDGSAQIIAPMPGKVVRVLVEQGAAVEAGQGLVVVEAMKMQNELKSPRAGRVAQLHASAGATVNAGDVLAVIE
ncbi:MAG TPA: biotin/lipoyl-containing protein [Pyrinomonadaceae bacterium]|jgi:biotin carboxyl carrier protein|nr:biotin/lipoyl-containing protein [Pyrinomonadaceae bacterium]